MKDILIINSSSDQWPKTLLIRNHEGGLVWQVYHVQKISEARALAKNASVHGFSCITLEDHQIETEETWPYWRDTDGGKKICE